MLLLVIGVALNFQPAAAQATVITQFTHPTYGVAGGLDPLEIQAVITYQNAKPNYTLVVAIIDLDAKPRALAPGLAQSSPDPCYGQMALSAICPIRLQSASGKESLNFKVGGIFGEPHGIGFWNLNITAALYDAENNLLPDSVSSEPFRIIFTPLTLTVLAPDPVPVTVDGVAQPPGTITLAITAGPHNISVPQTFQVDESTRVIFAQWRDGYNKPNRTVLVNRNIGFEAIYNTQYRLTFEGDHPTATGDGWYDAGATAEFSVSETAPMPGILGLLGGKLGFNGWYENGRPISRSLSASIVMDQPHNLTINWTADYTMPIVIFAVIVLAVVLLVFLLIRGSKARRPRASARASRTHESR